MPNNTVDAIDWALTQTDANGNLITKSTSQELVDKVREYFNENNIEYNTFSYDDLVSFLN